MNDVLILAGARTPFAAWSFGATGRGTPGGALKELDPQDLAAAALKGALSAAGLAPRDVNFIAFGVYPYIALAVLVIGSIAVPVYFVNVAVA